MPISQTKSHPGLCLGLLVALVPALLTSSGCATIEPFSGESVDLAIEHMLHAVGEAAKISSSRAAKPSDFELSQISVTLETVAAKKTSGELTLGVVTLDASREGDFTQSVTVLLEGPKKAAKSTIMTEDDITSPHPNMVRGLAEGFDTAYLAARGGQEGLRRSGDTPLQASKITVEINFTVTGSASATPAIEILGVDLTAGRTRSRENVHQVTMVFERSDPKQ